MIAAYDKFYLDRARRTFGNMIDCAVNGAHVDVRTFWDRFLDSRISVRFANGDCSVVAGRSGAELVMEILETEEIPDMPDLGEEKSPAYWAGWALAYYQWKTGYSYRTVDGIVPVEEIIGMYTPYHEMDIRQFCDRMDERMAGGRTVTNLKKIRQSRGLTQCQLSDMTEIPLRTIQQYEQRQKNINNARGEYLIALSKTLYCPPENLLEPMTKE